MESEDDFYLPTWAYEHTVYGENGRETVLSYNEDDTQLDEDLEIASTEELVRRKDLPDKWRCNACGAQYFWERNHEDEGSTCPDCCSTDTELTGKGDSS